MPTPSRPQGGPSAHSAVAWAQSQILDLVGSRQLGAGQKLPPERYLATRVGVSRASVREAISALVTTGVLDARHGAGVFVTSLDPVQLFTSFAPVFGLIAAEHADHIARLHAQLEAASAGRAAARARPTELTALHQALAELHLAEAEPQTRHADDRFRRTIWHLSDDRFHRAVAHLAEDPVGEGMIALLRQTRDELVPGTQVHDLGAHGRLVQAIAARDPELAAAVARQLVQEEFLNPGDDRDRAPGDDVVAVAPPAVPGENPAEEADAGGPIPVGANFGSVRPGSNSKPLTEPLLRATPSWFGAAKLGLIVHWGVYSIPGWAPLDHGTAGPGFRQLTDRPAEGHHRAQHPFAEWYESAAALPGSRTAEYHQRVHGGRKYAGFLPEFNRAMQAWQPEDWAAQFADAGARYVVQVAKHHDGFLLWPSRVRHPNRENWRASRDVVGELATAVRARGMRYGGVLLLRGRLVLRERARPPTSRTSSRRARRGSTTPATSRHSGASSSRTTCRTDCGTTPDIPPPVTRSSCSGTTSRRSPMA